MYWASLHMVQNGLLTSFCFIHHIYYMHTMTHEKTWCRMFFHYQNCRNLKYISTLAAISWMLDVKWFIKDLHRFFKVISFSNSLIFMKTALIWQKRLSNDVQRFQRYRQETCGLVSLSATVNISASLVNRLVSFALMDLSLKRNKKCTPPSLNPMQPVWTSESERFWWLCYTATMYIKFVWNFHDTWMVHIIHCVLHSLTCADQ